MLNLLEKNKQYIFLGIIFLVIIIIIIYFSSKNGKLLNYIDDLRQRIEELEETLQQDEQKSKPKNLDDKKNPSQQLNNLQNQHPQNHNPQININRQMNIPQMQPQINIPQINIPESFNPNLYTFEQKKPRNKSPPPPLPSSPPVIISNKHISFNIEVEEIEPSDDENDYELDAEIAEELKELNSNEFLNEEETDLKNDE